MPDDLYEILALGMRYWFLLLGALIVWRSFRWLRKDRREKHRRLRQLPDAGMIGELVVLVGSDELPEGTAIPVPREGVLGFLRTCDVVVPVPGVAGHHLDFTFQDGKGLLITPWRGQSCQVDADELTHRSKAAHYPMHHGSRLFVGDAVLRLRLFAGLETSAHPAFAPDAPETEQTPVTAWQDTPYIYHQHPAAWVDTGRMTPLDGQQPPYAPMEQPPCQPPYPQAYQTPYDPQAGQLPYQTPYDPQAGQLPYQAPYDPQAGQLPYQTPYAPRQDWLDSGYPQGGQRPVTYLPPAGDGLADAPEEEAHAPADSAEDFGQPRPRVRHSLLGRRNRHEE
ncbi:MAG: hypothetical protein ACI4O7_10785 [Aristaeellaceae bacterium]